MFHTKNSTRSSKVAINTSALPDIIFMLLFFFMVVTVIRQQASLVKVKLPYASELTKLENRSLVNHIYIGPKASANVSSDVAIQIQDAFIPVNRVQHAVKTLVATKTERLQPLVNTALKVDGAVEMGIVNDVKLALRKENQLKLNYIALPESQ